MSGPAKQEPGGGLLVNLTAALNKCADCEESQVKLLEEEVGLSRKRTETTSNFFPFFAISAKHTEKQTGLAVERTALTREQTRLSTRSTELASVRTDLARQRSTLAEERTNLAIQRTEMARERTVLSQGRTKLAEGRTDMARRRTDLADERTRMASARTDLARERNSLSVQRTSMAGERTVRSRTQTRLSLQRTELARGRTYLALTRTGLAFLTLGVTLLRYFGITVWTFFDGGLIVLSAGMIYFGVKGFRRAQHSAHAVGLVLRGDSGFADLFETAGRAPAPAHAKASSHAST